MKEQVFFLFLEKPCFDNFAHTNRKTSQIYKDHILYLLISARLNYLEIVTVSKAKQTF